MSKAKKMRLVAIGALGAAALFLIALIVLVVSVIVTKVGGAKEVVYTPGVFTETGYESEAVGFRFTTPENCTLATEEQLASLLGLSHDLMEGSYEDWELYYAEQATVYDMMASMPSGANVNVIWARTEGSSSEPAMVDQIKQELEALDFMDVKVQDGYEKVEIAGREYVKMVAVTTMNGIEMIQEYYVDSQKGYSVSMTLTYFEGLESEREVLLSAFEEK